MTKQEKYDIALMLTLYSTSKGNSCRRQDIVRVATTQMIINNFEDQNRVTSSGAQSVDKGAEWCIQRLLSNGYIRKTTYAEYSITQKGKKYIEDFCLKFVHDVNAGIEVEGADFFAQAALTQIEYIADSCLATDSVKDSTVANHTSVFGSQNMESNVMSRDFQGEWRERAERAKNAGAHAGYLYHGGNAHRF